MSRIDPRTTDTLELLDRVQMSPGERARTKARVAQVEAFLDMVFAAGRQLRTAAAAAAEVLSTIARRGRAAHSHR